MSEDLLREPSLSTSLLGGGVEDFHVDEERISDRSSVRLQHLRASKRRNHDDAWVMRLGGKSRAQGALRKALILQTSAPLATFFNSSLSPRIDLGGGSYHPNFMARISHRLNR